MEKLKIALEKLNISADDVLLDSFEKYMDAILEANEHVNLTAITDRDGFIAKHFIDSVLCAAAPEVAGARTVVDIGTGAGFPGIPLALIFPEKQFVLNDSLAKRLKIIDDICGGLHIANVRTVHARAEEMGQTAAYRESFDLCVSRAVANMSTLSEYCLPLVRKGGCFLAYKGPDYAPELEAAAKAIRTLGGTVKRVDNASMAAEDTFDHKLIFIEKTGTTPAKFPRKAGTPAKDPL